MAKEEDDDNNGESLCLEETSVLLDYDVLHNLCNCSNTEELRMRKFRLSLKPTINAWVVY